MKYVAARIAAGAVLTATASLLLTVVNVYAADKPGNPGNHFGEISNPGHHYGQLKHQPTPSPSPTPTPAPTSTPPTSTGQPPASAPSGTTSGDTSTDPAGAASTGVAALPATLPVSSNPQSTAAGIKAPTGHPDGLSWLILLILPALIAVWLMVFARAALTAVRVSRKPA